MRRPICDLALHSLRSLQEIGAETGIEYDRATRGVLKIYRSQQSLDGARALDCEFLAEHGLLYRARRRRSAAWNSSRRSQTRHLPWPAALYFPRDEVGDCNKFTQGLAAACAARGVHCRFGETVQRIETTGGRVTASSPTRAGSRPTPSSSRWAASPRRCCATVGIRVPIYPVKGVSITFPRGDWNGAPQMPVIDDSKLFGLVPIGDRMRISGSAEITGYDTTPATARCRGDRRQCELHFPRDGAPFRPRKAAKFWAGLRPVSPPARRSSAQTRIDGLWINAGHGHLGWTLSCGSGRVLADLIDGRDPGILPPPAQGDLVLSSARAA